MSAPRNVVEKSLVYPDGSTYQGQCLEDRTSTAHGYGVLLTKDNFEMSGFFDHGKSVGIGRFTAPNGDVFYGSWNSNHKRHGKGLFIKAQSGNEGGNEDKPQLYADTYLDGNLLKRIKTNDGIYNNVTHWLPLPPLEYASDSQFQFPQSLDPSEAKDTDGTAPCERFGHTFTEIIMDSISSSSSSSTASNSSSQRKVQYLLYGGRTTQDKGPSVVLDDMWVLEVSPATDSVSQEMVAKEGRAACLSGMTWARAYLQMKENGEGKTGGGGGGRSSSNSSSSGLQLPALHHHSVTAIGNGQLVVIGGEADVSGLSVNSSIYVIDMKKGEMIRVKGGSNGLPVTGHSTVYIPNFYEYLSKGYGVETNSINIINNNTNHGALLVIVQSSVFVINCSTFEWYSYVPNLNHHNHNHHHPTNTNTNTRGINTSRGTGSSGSSNTNSGNNSTSLSHSLRVPLNTIYHTAVLVKTPIQTNNNNTSNNYYEYKIYVHGGEVVKSRQQDVAVSDDGKEQIKCSSHVRVLNIHSHVSSSSSSSSSSSTSSGSGTARGSTTARDPAHSSSSSSSSSWSETAVSFSWDTPIISPPHRLDDPDATETKGNGGDNSGSSSSSGKDSLAAAAQMSHLRSMTRDTYSGITQGGYDTDRARHTATLVDGRYIYYIGGWTSTNPRVNVIDTTTLCDVQVLDTYTLSWSSPFIRYPLCIPRSDHTASLVSIGYNNKPMILVLGGTNPGRGNKGMWDLSLLSIGIDLRDHITMRALQSKEKGSHASTSSTSSRTSLSAPSTTPSTGSGGRTNDSQGHDNTTTSTTNATITSSNGDGDDGNNTQLLALLARLQAGGNESGGSNTNNRPSQSSASSSSANNANKPRAKWGR